MKTKLEMTPDLTRPDKEQAERIEEALLLQKSAGVGVAKPYMEHHGVSRATLLRVLFSAQQVPLELRSTRRTFLTESALDEALDESFPASDPVAISIT